MEGFTHTHTHTHTHIKFTPPCFIAIPKVSQTEMILKLQLDMAWPAQIVLLDLFLII